MLIGLVLLVLLVTVVRFAAGLHARRRRQSVSEPPPTRFMGTQFDLAILVLGLVLILVVVGWIYQAFFG